VASHHPAGGDPPGQPGHKRDAAGIADRLDAAVVSLDALRDRPAVSVAAALAVVAVLAGGWWLGRPGTAAPVENAIPLAATSAVPAPGPAPSAPSPASTGPEILIVHVAGAVARPGIVELEPGSRVVDAITAAGGPAGDADVHQLNLAAEVSDGLQIRVPREGEVVEQPAAASGGTAAGGGLVNLNQASAQELDELPGIGPALAAAIVDWRTEHGPFAAVGDLESVPGIGPAKLAALLEHVTL
jgi:competence protein ComEA